MNMDIKVLIVDDHPIVRQGLRRMVESEPRLEVIGEAEDGRAALELIEKARPDVVVLDIDMPEMDGFATAEAIRQRGYDVKIIFLTMHKDEELFNEALNLGAKGYVLKDSASQDIVSSIKSVAAGQNFISPTLSTYLLTRAARVADLARSKPSLNQLTPAERRVLKLISENKTSREIAAALGVSQRTVDNHRTNICAKLELRGSHALLKFALEHKAELA